MSFLTNFQSYVVRRSILEEERQEERQRVAFLNDNSKIPKNDPALFRPTKVRVLRAFFVRGERVEPGQVVEIERHLAESLASVGKCEIVE
ncbi:MAG: hypothetical protein IT393_10725 [Nitrospirae bacterium]|nr:hypothetical protein [Nitrospirota bacterium]